MGERAAAAVLEIDPPEAWPCRDCRWRRPSASSRDFSSARTTSSSGRSRPPEAPLVEVEHPLAFTPKQRSREDLGALLPRLEGVVIEPAPIVEAEASLTSRSITSRLSAREAASGSPCVARGSQASASTSAICSGENGAGGPRAAACRARPAAPRRSASASRHLRCRLQPPRDLRVALPLSGVQDHFAPTTTLCGSV